MVGGKEDEGQIDRGRADLHLNGIREIAGGSFRIGLARECSRELQVAGVVAPVERFIIVRLLLPAISDDLAGCSKRPDFSPAQPPRAETRLVPSKAAASEIS